MHARLANESSQTCLGLLKLNNPTDKETVSMEQAPVSVDESGCNSIVLLFQDTV